MTDKDRLKKYWDEERRLATYLCLDMQIAMGKDPDTPVSRFKRAMETEFIARYENAEYPDE